MKALKAPKSTSRDNTKSIKNKNTKEYIQLISKPISNNLHNKTMLGKQAFQEIVCNFPIELFKIAQEVQVLLNSLRPTCKALAYNSSR